MEYSKTSLPVRFEASNQSGDSRFQRVKIWIAHTGENLNGSTFSKEVLEAMIPSLEKIPIVGSIKSKDDGESDFGSHEKKLEIKDGDLSIKFDTVAYGFVGSDHEAKFEISEGKEWLTAKGYLWTRFADANEIFEQSNGSKSQSMEVIKMSGQVDDQGRFEVNAGVFSALCILGDDVPPAMTGSVITTEYSDTINTHFKEMMNEFTAEKGDAQMAENKKKKPIDSEKNESGSDKKETQAPEKLDEKTKEVTPKADDKSDEKSEVTTDDKEGKKATDDKKMKAKKKTFTYELEVDDKRYAITQAMISQFANKDEYTFVYVAELYDAHAIVEVDHGSESETYDVAFSVDESDHLKVSSTTKVVSMYLSEEEVAKIKGSREKITELTQELEKFKAKEAFAENEKLLETYAEQLGDEKVKEFKEASNFSVLKPEELRTQIALALLPEAEKQTPSAPATDFAVVANGKSTKDTPLGEPDLKAFFE